MQARDLPDINAIEHTVTCDGVTMNYLQREHDDR